MTARQIQARMHLLLSERRLPSEEVANDPRRRACARAGKSPGDVAIVYDYEAHGVARADQRAQNQRLDAGDLMPALILPLHLCVDPCPYASEWRPAKT
jgi:hypothetical protein